jgi:hypothetical protein
LVFFGLVANCYKGWNFETCQVRLPIRKMRKILDILVVWQPDPRSFKHTSKHTRYTPRLSMLSSMAIKGPFSAPFSGLLPRSFRSIPGSQSIPYLYFTITHVNPLSCWEKKKEFTNSKLMWWNTKCHLSLIPIPIPLPDPTSLIARSQSWVMLSSSLRSSSKSSNPVVSLATPGGRRKGGFHQVHEPTKLLNQPKSLRIWEWWGFKVELFWIWDLNQRKMLHCRVCTTKLLGCDQAKRQKWRFKAQHPDWPYWNGVNYP